MMQTKKENFDEFRQFGLGDYEIRLLHGGSGDGGGGTGGNGGGSSEPEEPPPIWIDDKTSQTSQRKTS